MTWKTGEEGTRRTHPFPDVAGIPTPHSSFSLSFLVWLPIRGQANRGAALSSAT